MVIELKKPGVPARAAFNENLTHYTAEIPQFFWFNALLVALRSLAELALSAQAGIGPCDLKYRVQFV